MCVIRSVLLVTLLLSGFGPSNSAEDVGHHSAHKLRSHKSNRRHRAANATDGGLRFESGPYSKKLETNTTGKIHCKVAGGVSPTVQWYLNEQDPLPDGVTSTNGTLLVTEASRRHAGNYTCRAVDGENVITSKITLDIVVFPRVIEPSGGALHIAEGDTVLLDCKASGDPAPTTHWDRNLTILHQQQDGVDVENGVNASTAKLVLLNNGSLLIRNVSAPDADRYGCTAGSTAGMARGELLLHVIPPGDLPPQESSGVAGKAVVVSISVAGAYMVLVLALMVYCRRRRLRRRQRGEKMELEMVEGREKLVEEGGEDKPKVNGAPAGTHNGRLVPHERDSGADNSEVSAISRASKKSGQYDRLSVPRTLLTEQIILGRGEFGDVFLGKIDMSQVRKLRGREDGDAEPQLRPVLVKALTTKDEVQLAEFRRQLDMFSRVRHEHLARLVGLCSDTEPHYMLLEHTDWGDLKNFLIATRTPEESAEYMSRVGNALPPEAPSPSPARPPPPPLAPPHRALLAAQLAAAGHRLASDRITHRDIAARNCLITSKLQLKLSCCALTRGPHAHEYHKLHDQVIPLRWLPLEAVAEGEYSTKSDVYMFAATVWEIYTKAELPFAKLNDNSVLERLKSGTLEWSIPDSMPDAIASILNRCWNNSPKERPHFGDVCEQLGAAMRLVASDNESRQSQDKSGDEA